MLNQTLFILGAGSSAEVDFPDGRGLAEKIASDANIHFEEFTAKTSSGSQRIANAIRKHAPTQVNEYRRAAIQIARGLPFANSIDTFLDSFKNDQQTQLCGKLGIVNRILEAEHACDLFRDPNKNWNELTPFPKLKDAWFVKLFRSLSERVPRENPELVFEQVSFINFNYDRCLEHFLIHALQARFALSGDDAKRAMSRLKIIHPYGKVGDLPWESNNDFIEFGNPDRSPDLLLSAASKIRTFTEGIENEKLKEDMTKLIEEAGMVVFLGFAYYPQNMQLITPSNKAMHRRSHKKALGTALGVSDSDIRAIKQSIGYMLEQVSLSFDVDLANATCSALFDQYRRTLFK